MFSACFTLQSNKGEIYFFFVMKAVTFIYLQGLASGTFIKKKKSCIMGLMIKFQELPIHT